MKKQQTIIATFSDLEKAQEARDRLVQAGIPAEVQDETKLQKYWFLSRSLAADKVLVDEKDFEKARSVLQAADVTDHVLQGELRCPKCGSADIEYPQFTRKFVTTTLVEVFCFLHVIDKEFYCKKCQHTWPASVALRPKTDILNWPKKDGDLVKKE
jgi:predicted nucleic-acid-binding Zn-ribbon protein